jgi:hypothetical protein
MPTTDPTPRPARTRVHRAHVASAVTATAVAGLVASGAAPSLLAIITYNHNESVMSSRPKPCRASCETPSPVR